MKSNSKYTALLLAAGVALVSTTQAQPVTGTPYLSNVSVADLLTPPSATYAGWAGAAGISQTATGINVQNSGYGSLYYVLPPAQVQTMSPLATQIRLTLTVGGDPAAYNWVGTPFTVNADSGSWSYGGYSGSGNPGNPASVTWSGNTMTWEQPLAAGHLTGVQTGTDHIYSFTLQFDPAVAPSSYDITFNSLELLPVPEPASIGLAGLGIATLLVIRRRK
jgi:hypothetical protein